MSKKILMKNGVALWLIKHTSLSDRQIGQFCSIHPLKINFMRMNISEYGSQYTSPIGTSLTMEEIVRCENDKSQDLEPIVSSDFSIRKNKVKSVNLYNAILWVIKNYENVKESKIAELLSCNTITVKSIKNGTLKGIEELTPLNPVALDLCTQEALDIFIKNEVN